MKTDRTQLLKDIAGQAKTLFPLFHYLVLQTETHAFCLALACAALIGFYPFCVLLLSLLKNVFHWNGGYDTLLFALETFYPTEPEFLIRNLKYTLSLSGHRFELGSVIWVFFGAAGVFIPLEAGFNRLWKVEADRPYWRNQLVGFTLTAACCLLAIVFVAINAAVRAILKLPIDFLEQLSDRLMLHLTAACFFAIAIFLFYKFLPNRKVDTFQVLPAAVLAGVVAELVKDIYVLFLPLMDIGSNQGSHGPFYISISFVVLGYFETFVVLGGAFLATHSDKYPWMGFIKSRKSGGLPPGGGSI